MNEDFTRKEPGFILTEPVTAEPVLTMVFAQMQPITQVYSPEDALKNGTLFKNLDKPLTGRNPLC